ncbi:MAG: shikimate kinase [Candidatus Nanopelagicaceae bacterium]|nr:shikimate kinase [Candidatus Nanopelagicaceae bacterium]
MTPRIILIGPPGAGKTSIGRSLARALHVPFVDTDTLIEADQGKPISQIFIEDTEPVFRQIEERICLDALSNEGGVLSLGGGAVLTKSVHDSIQKCGADVIFLDVSLKVAAPRIGFNRDRPLLLNNPRAQWQNLMEARRPIYEGLATLIFEVEDRTVNQIVKDLLLKVSA